MADREMVREALYSESFYGYSDICWTIPATIQWLQGLLAEVPPEYQDASRFEIDSESDYDGGYSTSLNIYYDRPITDAEIAAQEAERKASVERYAAEQQARELATYQALRRKYG